MATITDRRLLDSMGVNLRQTFATYKKNRYEVEQQWLRNLRQTKGHYDPEVEKKFRKDGSRAYPRATRVKAIGTVARIMEMMFPQSEKNWAVEATKVPNLSEEDTAAAIKLATEKAVVPNTPTNNEIERQVRLIAQERAEKMSTEIADELDEMEYITLARKVVFSGVIFGLGVMKGPYHLKETVRTWLKNINGAYVAETSTRLKPMFEFVPVWNYYPDLSAKCKEQYDWEFERNPMSRASVAELRDRPDFMSEMVDEVLKKYPTGNYMEEDWEKDLRSKKSNRENVADITTNKYEYVEGYGRVTGAQLTASGEAVPASELDKLFTAQVAMIGDVIIKAVRLPEARKSTSPFHTFVYTEDDINTVGSGLPEIIRDSQMAICEAARMLLDNASAVSGPMIELDLDLLMEGQPWDPHAFKVYIKEGRKGSPTNAGNRAVQDVTVNSHIPELLNVLKTFMEFMDLETALPPPALGDPTKGGSEALRTQGGASMIMGAAALPIRDVVRNFDRFTTSAITALYDWNMEFRAKPEIKGDFMVIARGSTSLIAKEVRSLQLDQLSVTLNESQMDHIKERRLVEERLKVRDLAEDLLEDEAVVVQKRAARERAQQQAQQLATQTAQATIRKTLSEAVKNISQANKNTASATVDVLNTLLEALNGTGDNQGAAGGAEGKTASVSGNGGAASRS
jgi:hypothetical protein